MSELGELFRKNHKEMSKQVLDHCAGRLDKDELKELQDLLDGQADSTGYQIEEMVDKKGMNGNMASDSRLGYDTRSYRTSGAAVREMQAVRAAEAECAPVLGGRVLACDSAPEVYREALKVMGQDVSTIPAAACAPLYRGLREKAANGGVTYAAGDQATKDFNARFPTASKLATR